jgi:peroxiredoxin Q/BCP
MATHLTTGQKAPLFTSTDQNGSKISLASLKGRKVILYFYPEDDTPACTTQSCNLRDNYVALEAAGYTIIGISPNDTASHARFASKFSLPFSLLPDPKHAIIEKYGVWGEKNLYGRKYNGLHRTTFVIDESGSIQRIFLRPKNAAHSEEILKGAQ